MDLHQIVKWGIGTNLAKKQCVKQFEDFASGVPTTGTSSREGLQVFSYCPLNKH